MLESGEGRSEIKPKKVGEMFYAFPNKQIFTGGETLAEFQDDVNVIFSPTWAIEEIGIFQVALVLSVDDNPRPEMIPADALLGDPVILVEFEDRIFMNENLQGVISSGNAEFVSEPLEVDQEASHMYVFSEWHLNGVPTEVKVVGMESAKVAKFGLRYSS